MTGLRPLPPGSCDCHSHLYPPADTFPVRPGQHHEPKADAADYLAICDGLGVERHVLVQGKAYPDLGSLLHGIAAIGPARCRGIVFFDESLDDLAMLDAQGIRGFRFLYRAGEPVDMAAIHAGAESAAAQGWHVIVQAEGADLVAHYDALLALPCAVVIDHMGRLPRGGDVDDPAARALLDFLKAGGWVKLASPYNLTMDKRSDFASLSGLIRALVQAAPERLIWGLNFPHPNLSPDDKPDEDATLHSLLGLLDARQKRQIFVENPGLLYGLG